MRMMERALRPVLFLILSVFAGPAAAHPGHIADLAGHDHWVAGAAIGAAIGSAIWGHLKGKKAESKDEEPEDTAEEATA